MKMKKGFSLIELIITMAIIAIMGAVLFMSKNDQKASSDVESISRQISAQVRSLQNEALNGKKIDTDGDGVGDTSACFFHFKIVSLTYVLSYGNCVDGAEIVQGTQIVDVSTKRVTFNIVGADFFFASPRGQVSSAQAIGINSIVDPAMQGCVKVSADGVVSEQKTACL